MDVCGRINLLYLCSSSSSSSFWSCWVSIWAAPVHYQEQFSSLWTHNVIKMKAELNCLGLERKNKLPHSLSLARACRFLFLLSFFRQARRCLALKIQNRDIRSLKISRLLYTGLLYVQIHCFLLLLVNMPWCRLYRHHCQTWVAQIAGFL